MGGTMKRALPLILLCLAARAEDLTTTEGKVYKEVTIRKVEPDGLAIMHAEGLAKVPFTKLSAEIQKKHGYDPAKAKEFAEKQEAQQKANEDAIDRGLAVQAREQKVEEKPAAETPAPAVTRKPGRLVLGKKTKKQEIGGRILQVLQEGLLFSGGSGSPWLMVDHPEQRTLTDGRTVKCYAVKTEAIFEYTDLQGGARTVAVWQYAGKRLGR